MGANLWTAPVGPLLDGTSVAATTFTTAQALVVGATGAGQKQINGGQLHPGSQISVEAWGVASNTSTPTLALGVFYGAAGSVALAVSAAKTTTTAMSNWEWHLWYSGRIITVGPTGSIIGSGYWRLPTSLTAWTEFRLPETAPAAVTIDTSVNKAIGIQAAWGTSSASNSITIHDCRVEVHG